MPLTPVALTPNMRATAPEAASMAPTINIVPSVAVTTCWNVAADVMNWLIPEERRATGLLLNAASVITSGRLAAVACVMVNEPTLALKVWINPAGLSTISSALHQAVTPVMLATDQAVTVTVSELLVPLTVIVLDPEVYRKATGTTAVS